MVFGGAQRVSHGYWEIPFGVFGKNVVVDIAEIPGDMPCLLSRRVLKDWGGNIDVESGELVLEPFDGRLHGRESVWTLAVGGH